MLNQTCAMKLKLQEALDKQEHGKDHIRSLEKEIQLLKQQLQGRIKTGETFPWQQEREGKERRVEEDKKQQPKKKQQQRRATINLLEVLQMSEDTTTTSDTTNNKNVDNLKTSCIDDKVGVAGEEDVSPDKVGVASNDKENLAEVGVASAISDSSPLKEVKCKTVLHKTVKVTDTIVDMDQQCRQQ